jgi:hypothetical protein
VRVDVRLALVKSSGFRLEELDLILNSSKASTHALSVDHADHPAAKFFLGIFLFLAMKKNNDFKMTISRNERMAECKEKLFSFSLVGGSSRGFPGFFLHHLY